ncbi:hypothetical protein GA0115259_114371, partial [Streptomyces sp. MnatMP-M17]
MSTVPDLPASGAKAGAAVAVPAASDARQAWRRLRGRPSA